MAQVQVHAWLDPELIVLQTPAAQRAPGFDARDRAGLYEVATALGVELVPLFDGGAGRPALAPIRERLRPLPQFFRVLAPADQLEELRFQLQKAADVVAAYIKPPALPAQLNTMPPSGPPAAPMSPDYASRQIYLEPAPGGVDGEAAWRESGGRGKGITIADVEGGWRLDHEELNGRISALGAGRSTDPDWIEHGTAVMACCVAAHSGSGVKGLAPEARGIVVSALDAGGSSVAIRVAADALEPGDILVIELHRPGPRYQFQLRADQKGFIPIEWWPDDLAVIQYAVGLGLTVVEAGGNGAEDLDDAIYTTGDPNFPPDWQNPFSAIDSRAVLVGAGAPPAGTHGNDWGTDRSRLDFSNYGQRVDVQAWGREVTTAGYGDLQGGPDPTRWYSDQFSGTSSATPIVAGVAACLQGIARARGGRLSPDQMRQFLRTLGSAQQTRSAGTLQHIGLRPDLAALVAALAGMI